MKKILSLILLAVLLLSMTACGQEEAAEPVDLAALYESYGSYMPDMFVPDEDTLMNFLGIDVADCKQYVVVICADGMRTDEVWLIEAVDDAALDRLKTLAETRLVAKADETISYAPDQYLIVEQAELLTQGNYLALLVSPDVEAMKAAFEEAMQ